jgi:hypothetical protein
LIGRSSLDCLKAIAHSEPVNSFSYVSYSYRSGFHSLLTSVGEEFRESVPEMP